MDWYFAVLAADVLIVDHVESFVAGVHYNIEVGRYAHDFAESLS
jgi:hypothetical protein